MKEDRFQFFRGSYYRWAQLWPEVCPDLLDAPVVLPVGDRHLDRLGTQCSSSSSAALFRDIPDDRHRAATRDCSAESS